MPQQRVRRHNAVIAVDYLEERAMVKGLVALWVSILVAAGVRVEAAAAPEAFLADAESMPGFLPLYWDSDSGDLHADIGGLDGPLFYYTGLWQGVGSNDLGLDCGRLGDTHLVQFERVGSKVLLKALNTRYVARSESTAQSAAVAEAFAQSVLWGFEVAAEGDG
jgi:hypothetical protein